jgi:hypothetical protein
MANILGKLSAGAASNKAKAGPLDICRSNKALTMGTSVRVEKYIKLPIIEAMKLENRLFEPT